MTKKKMTILNIVLVLLLILIGYGYYQTFFQSESKKEQKKVEDTGSSNVFFQHYNNIDYIYLCEEDNNKYYSESNNTGNGNVKCHRTTFSCENCAIDSTYIDEKILYYTKNKINYYDLKNKKLIDEIEVYENEYGDKNTTIKYNQNDNVYGFIYKNNKNLNMFYNLENKQQTLLKGNMCNSYVDKVNENPTEHCEKNLNNNNNIIHNDKVVIEIESQDNNNLYGLLNLKTGKYDINPEKKYLYFKSQYIFNEDDSEGKQFEYYIIPFYDNDFNSRSIYDKDLNIILKNDDKNTKLYSSNYMNYLYENIIVADVDYSYLTILDSTGKEYPNMKLSKDKISKEIYSLIENKELKNKITEVGQIFTEVEYNNGININYNKEDNTVYFEFYYHDSYYETYISVYYKYNLTNNTLEKYNQCENGECGEY